MNQELLSQLERLAKLKNDGAITEQEFGQQKAALLKTQNKKDENIVYSPSPAPDIIPQKIEKRKKGLSRTSIVIICILVYAIAYGIYGNLTKTDADRKADSLATLPVPETPKPEKNRTEIVSGFFSYYDGSHRALENAIKKSMNDPDSYEHIETRFRDDGATIYVVTKFRGKNAFGGRIVNYAEATLNGQTGELIDWRFSKG